MKEESERNLRTILDLAQSIGEIIEYWGFKRTHGEVWALIFLSMKPVDANFLVDTLGVSKATISSTLTTLTDYGVIELMDKTRPSTQKYVSHPNILQAIFNVLKKREIPMITNMNKMVKKVRSISREELYILDVNPEKLQQLEQMINSGELLLKSIVTLTKFNFGLLRKAFFD